MTKRRGYQVHLSRENPVLKDVNGRSQKFRKILSVLRDFDPHFSPSIGVDLGCSSGVMTSLLGEKCRMTLGIDMDQEAVRYAKEHYASSHIHFIVADGMALPLKNGSADTVLCNHVYEHVPDAMQLMEDIYRVLAPDGICYFAAGNRYMLMEGHYGLPFLSWLPDRLGHLYLKWAGKGDFYYEKHLSLRSLRNLVRKFRIHDYTVRIIEDPERFSAGDLIRPNSLLHRVVSRCARYIYPWIPTYIWILTKK
jgi:SAM-dependent methyltransferase